MYLAGFSGPSQSSYGDRPPQLLPYLAGAHYKVAGFSGPLPVLLRRPPAPATPLLSGSALQGRSYTYIHDYMYYVSNNIP